MATNSTYPLRILRFSSLLFIIFFTTSCARKISFGTSTVVPAAEGRVKVSKDDNGNNDIQVDIRNLAEAKKLTPSKSYYVVWMETDEGSVKNLGRLNSESGLFSKSLKASLNTVSPFKPRRIYVTAEDDPTIQYPGSQVVISTERF